MKTNATSVRSAVLRPEGPNVSSIGLGSSRFQTQQLDSNITKIYVGLIMDLESYDLDFFSFNLISCGLMYLN